MLSLGVVIEPCYAEPRSVPNVILILADDLGWSDTTPYGSEYHETPNIARLAERGMRFTQAYAANPLCSPTRASILTGLYPGRIGITAPVCHLPEERFEATLAKSGPSSQRVVVPHSVTRLKQEYVTLAEVLGTSGYTTGHFGKWHLGPEPYDPLHQGFSVDLPHHSGPGPAGSYVAPWKFPERLNFRGEPGEHIEDRMAREAVKFLRANRDRPFFLNYWAFSVHSPWDAKPDLIERFDAKDRRELPQQNPVYAAMVKSLDDAVGTLLDALDELQIAERTIVVFFSDNGGWIWEARNVAPRFQGPVTSNQPLRGGKATLYEGGTRVPCIVSWPGKTTGGSVSGALLSSVDLFPTILDMCGVPLPEGQRVDGVSQTPALIGKGKPRDTVYCHFPHYTPATGAIPATWVRRGDWKLIRFHHDHDDGRNRYELYRLSDDLGESTNLADSQPYKLTELDPLISAHLRDIGAPVPSRNPNYGAVAAPRSATGPSVAGWRAGNNVRLSVKEDRLQVRATGPDPHLSTQDVPAAIGPLTVTLRMKSTTRGAGQLYWGEQDARPMFARERSVDIPLQSDGEWREYRLLIAPSAKLAALRLDPGSTEGEVEVEWLRMFDASGKMLREWKFTP